MNPENQLRRRRQQRWLYLTGVALVISLIVLIGAIVLLNAQTQRLARETSRQQDLNARLRQLQLILVNLADAEAGQRGYLLTGRRQYLSPYVVATARMPLLLTSLDDIPDLDPRTSERAQNVRDAVRTKLGDLAEAIRLYDGGDATAAMDLVLKDTGKAHSDRAREEIGVIVDSLRTERDRAAQALAFSGNRRQMLASGAAAVLAICIVLAGTQIMLLLRARSRFERDLAHSESRHRKIVEEQAELVSLAKPDGTLVYVNPAYSRHLRADARQLVGQNLFELVDRKDREAVRGQVQEVLRTGNSKYGENRVVTPDGKEMWVAWTNSVQAGQNGEPMLHSVGRDITARKRAEDALRASEDFLRRTGRVGGVGGWEVDLMSGHVNWSEQIRRIHEVEDSFEPTIDTAVSFYAPEVQERIRQAVRDAEEFGKSFDLEMPLITAKGRRICVRAIGEAERDAQGRFVRLIGTLQDVTQRKELEDRLREGERFLREVTDNLPVAIAFVDREGRYQFVNEMHVKRFQRPREQILGRTRAELADTPLHNGDQRVAAVLRGELQRFTVQESFGDSLRLIDAQLVPAYDEDRQIKGFYATGVDITDLKRAEMQLREITEIIENTPDAVVQTDWTGRVHYVNPTSRRLFGFSDDDQLKDHFFHEFNTPETNDRFSSEILPALKKDGVWLGETTVLTKGAKLLPVNHLVIAHRDAEGRIARYSAVMRDISQEVRARAELQLQTSTLRSIIEAIPALVAVFDKEYRYRLVNREFERQRAIGRNLVIGRSVAELFGQEEFDQRWPNAQKALAGETVHFERNAVHASQSRRVSVTYIPLRLEDGSVDGFITVAQDITTRHENEQRLLDLSERDALTGLLNRRGFLNYLERRLQSGNEGGLALLSIDLDRFKPINDTYGHAVGDEVLQQFSQRLRGLVRPSDAVARLGGDEFAIVLPDVRDRSAADMVAQKVVDAAAAAFAINGISIQIGASAGVALASSTDRDLKSLMETADERLYAAKAAGRGRRA